MGTGSSQDSSSASSSSQSASFEGSPSKGQVLFKGEPLPPRYQDRTRDQLRQAQMIYQMADTALNPRMSIGQIIARPVEFYLGLKAKEKRARVDKMV